jgi:UV DNA damage endonuclease
MPPKAKSRATTPRAPQLGLVCQTQDERIRFRTITRTALLALPADARPARLRALYRHNVERLADAVLFCRESGLHLYRIPSSLFPFSDTPEYAGLLDELGPDLGKIGGGAERDGLRLVMHPDQFVVLSSDSPQVIENSRTILLQHARLLDLLAQPQSPWAAINIHGGKAGRLDRLIAEIKRLPDGVRERLTLENDEQAYGAEEIHKACTATGVAMVFDAHHHVVHERLSTYDDPSLGLALQQAAGTWSDAAWQMTHISNGRAGFLDRAHSDFITTMPPCFRDAPFIEIEAKAKDQAITQLRKTWAA